MQVGKIEKAVLQMLNAVGEDPTREGLRETPKRVAEMYRELLSGNKSDPNKYVKFFDAEGARDMVLIRDIPVFSVCEHHMMPFHGLCHIAYFPKDKILGLSKFSRIVDCFSYRLQIQERLTKQICDFLMEKLDAIGVVVYIEAEHMCMVMRGARAIGSSTVTMTKRGCFEENSVLTNEFLQLIYKER